MTRTLFVEQAKTYLVAEMSFRIQFYNHVALNYFNNAR